MKLSRVLLPLAAVGLIALPFAINDINTARQNAVWDAHVTAMLKALPPPARWTPAWTPPDIPGVPSYAFDSCWETPATYCHRMRVALKSTGEDVAKFDCMINNMHYDNDLLSPLATT